MTLLDREGGGIHLLLSSMRRHRLRHPIWLWCLANLFQQYKLVCGNVSARGLRVLRFSEFTMRKINIYSTMSKWIGTHTKKSVVVVTATTTTQESEQTNKRTQAKKNYGKQFSWDSIWRVGWMCVYSFLEVLAKLLNCYLTVDLFVFHANETINPTIASIQF